MINDSYKDCLTDISDLIERLRKRSEIRLAITSRKSVQENQPDRISELLLEAANKIEEIADELIDAHIESAIRIGKLEQELARIKGLTMEYS